MKEDMDKLNRIIERAKTNLLSPTPSGVPCQWAEGIVANHKIRVELRQYGEVEHFTVTTPYGFVTEHPSTGSVKAFLGI